MNNEEKNPTPQPTPQPQAPDKRIHENFGVKPAESNPPPPPKKD